MTFRDLEYLVAVADHGHFGRAAESCHATQSTLSLQLQKLEAELGVQLVERTNRRVVVTPTGQLLVERARQILRSRQELLDDAAIESGQMPREITLGMIPTIAPFLLPRALPLLRSRFPDLRLYLKEDLTQRLIAALKSGHLDAALIALPFDLSGLDCAHVSDDEILAALPAGHRLAAQDRTRPSELEEGDLILLEDGHCLRDHALAACGLRPPRAGDTSMTFAATSLPTLVQMVGSGLGVTFLPSMAVAAGLTEGASIEIRPLQAEDPTREIVVAWRSGSIRGAEGRLLAETLRQA